jgi:uncharacterized protein YggU (UPF0235/DUF167 family)
MARSPVVIAAASIVRVAPQAVDGAATEAVLKAVAKAFGLRRAM